MTGLIIAFSIWFVGTEAMLCYMNVHKYKCSIQSMSVVCESRPNE